MHVFTARILVATGMPRENGQNTEIIDLINPKLEFEPIDNIPARSGSVGGLGIVSHKISIITIFDHKLFLAKIYSINLIFLLNIFNCLWYWLI